MSQLDRAGLISQSNFLFPDNTTAEITPSDIRQFNNDLADSLALTGSNVVSASYALTASYAENVTPIDTSSLATTGSNTFNGDQTISGSVTIQDTNAPMSGLVLKNNSGGGDVQIIPAGDFITTFNGSSLTGINTYGGNKISGSRGEVGVTYNGYGIWNSNTGSSIEARVLLGHNLPDAVSYRSFESIGASGKTNLRGDTVKVLGSAALESGVSMTVYGDVTASVFTGSFVGDATAALPNGTVSGSSQIILQDTTGDLSGSRINGQVASALSASHALNADNAISASHADFSDETDDVIINVKNTSGADIGKGLAVHATGVTGENVNIKLADSSVSGDMPAIGITRDAISNNATGVVILSGKVRGLNTSADGLVAGAAIYVNGAGVLTASKPTGSDLIQNIGICGKVDATDGEIIVMGSGRSNDLPNILNGYAWVGDTNGVPQAVATSSFAGSTIDTGSFATTGSNSFIGTEEITGSLFVSGATENKIKNQLTITSDTVDSPLFKVSNSAGKEFLKVTQGTQERNMIVSGAIYINGTGIGETGLKVINTNTDNATLTPKEFFYLSSGSGTRQAAMTSVGIMGTSVQQGGQNVFFSAAPYNLFEQGYNDVTSSYSQARGLFYNTGSRGAYNTPTLPFIFINDLLGGTFDNKVFIGNNEVEIINEGNAYFSGSITTEDTLIISQSAGETGSVIHFPVLSSQGEEGKAASRFYNPGGPSFFETSISGVDKFELQTVGNAAMDINVGTSLVLNPATSGNGNFVSTKIMTQQDSAISGNGQKDSIQIGSYTGANGVTYSTNTWGLQNYPGSGYNNAFTIGKYDSAFTYVSEFQVGEGKVQMTLGTGADTDYDFILLNDNGNGTSTIQLKADNIQSTLPVHSTFSAPSAGNTNLMTTVGGVTTNGVSYPITNIQFADYSNFSSTLYEDYFGVEMFGTGYAYGTEFTVNGQGIQLSQIPTGSAGAGAASFVKVVDNYNGTGNVEIGAPTGRVNIATVMKLGTQGSLPAGSSLGDLTVSGSNLYFHDGTNWREVSLV